MYVCFGVDLICEAFVVKCVLLDNVCLFVICALYVIECDDICDNFKCSFMFTSLICNVFSFKEIICFEHLLLYVFR